MSLNIDLRALEKANVDQLQAFHLENQVPMLAADLTSGTGVYYEGRLVTKSSGELLTLPADSLDAPTYKELDVIISKVDELKRAGFAPSKEFEDSMDKIRAYADVSRIRDHESTQEIAIET